MFNAIPLTIIALLNSTRLRPKAATPPVPQVQLPITVTLSRSEIFTPPNGSPINITADVIDAANQPVTGMTYTWSLTVSSIGTLISQNQSAVFTPSANGSGILQVDATGSYGQVSKSIRVLVNSSVVIIADSFTGSGPLDIKNW